MYNFNNLIFFGSILLICASTGNCLKCYFCTTVDDKHDCDHPGVTESADMESGLQVCLTIEYTRSNDSNSKFTVRQKFSLISLEKKNTTEACKLFKKSFATAEKSVVMSECVSCNTDLCNAPPPASPQQLTSDSKLKASSSSISLLCTSTVEYWNCNGRNIVEFLQNAFLVE